MIHQISGHGHIAINTRVLPRTDRAKIWLVRTILNSLALFGMFGTFEFSRAGAQYALDIVTGRNAGPGARTVYLACLTAAPTDASTNATMTELATAGYSRQSIAWTAPTAADPPETHNSGVITFGPFSADPPNVTHFAVVSSASGTGGDFLAWGALTAARDAATNDSLQGAIAAFSLTCS